MRFGGLKVMYSAAAALALSASLNLVGAPATSAEEIMVMIVDQEAPQTPGNAAQGAWGYAPFNVSAVKGDTIKFMQGENAFRPHTVTSITWTGQAPTRELASAKTFDSSPTRETYMNKGDSWVLDTATLDPGQILYYCTLHPWMVGTISLTAPAADAPATAETVAPTPQ
ncbi:MAG: hypothetical protein ACKVVP_21155 [Chloroflexota bacterium]